MYTPVHWIADVPCGRLGTMPRPRGGDWLDDELHQLAAQHINHLASALTFNELHELNLTQEPHQAHTHGMHFHHIPIADRHVPDHLPTFNAHIAELTEALQAGRAVVAHCRQGIGRASLIAAATLVHLDVPPERAWSMIEHARGRPVPDTPSQREWLDHTYTAFLRLHR